jgi:hypothetical protein
VYAAEQYQVFAQHRTKDSDICHEQKFHEVDSANIRRPINPGEVPVLIGGDGTRCNFRVLAEAQFDLDNLSVVATLEIYQNNGTVFSVWSRNCVRSRGSWRKTDKV